MKNNIKIIFCALSFFTVAGQPVCSAGLSGLYKKHQLPCNVLASATTGASTLVIWYVAEMKSTNQEVSFEGFIRWLKDNPKQSIGTFALVAGGTLAWLERAKVKEAWDSCQQGIAPDDGSDKPKKTVAAVVEEAQREEQLRTQQQQLRQEQEEQERRQLAEQHLKKESVAATKIQAHFRGHKTRKRVKQAEEQEAERLRQEQEDDNQKQLDEAIAASKAMAEEEEKRKRAEEELSLKETFAQLAAINQKYSADDANNPELIPVAQQVNHECGIEAVANAFVVRNADKDRAKELLNPMNQGNAEQMNKLKDALRQQLSALRKKKSCSWLENQEISALLDNAEIKTAASNLLGINAADVQLPIIIDGNTNYGNLQINNSHETAIVLTTSDEDKNKRGAHWMVMDIQKTENEQTLTSICDSYRPTADHEVDHLQDTFFKEAKATLVAGVTQQPLAVAVLVAIEEEKEEEKQPEIECRQTLLLLGNNERKERLRRQREDQERSHLALVEKIRNQQENMPSQQALADLPAENITQLNRLIEALASNAERKRQNEQATGTDQMKSQYDKDKIEKEEKEVMAHPRSGWLDGC